MKLLHIIASPRGERSASTEVAQTFIDACQNKHPGTNVDVLNVWDITLPPFDGPALHAKYAGLEGRTRSAEEAQVWTQITAYEELGLTWEYSAVDVTAAGLSGFLDSLGADWAGLSLTMPLKAAVNR